MSRNRAGANFTHEMVRFVGTVITDVNPFIYSHPLAPDDIIDRDDETTQLLTAAVGGHYVRLYAPRKYGKTSLLRRVLRDGERQEGLIPILVDLYGVLSIADVTIRFERAYARQLKGKSRSRVEEFLQSTGLGLSLGALGISAGCRSTRARIRCRRCTRCSTCRCGSRRGAASGR